jgi:O-antigen ligase
VDIFATRTLQLGFVLLALFIPFSIAGTNIALGFVGLGWILRTFSSRRGLRTILRDPMLIASLLLALSALPSVLISENRERAWGDWESYWQLIIYFGVAANLLACGMRETVVRVLAVSSILSCGVAFIQRAGGLDLGPIHIGAAHRVSSTMYIMTFAGVLAQLTVFYASTLIAGIGRKERLLYGAAAVLQMVALLLTMTRGAWLAAVAGFGVLVALVRSRRLFAVAAGLMVLLVVFTFVYANDQGRTISLQALLSSSPDRNVHTRLELWKTAWQLFTRHPVLGVGMGDYSTEAARMLAGTEGVLTMSDAHNVPLHILATRGLVGFIPFVFFWVMVFRVLANVMRGATRGSRTYQYAAGATAVAAAVLVGSLTENNIDDEEVFNAFMLILGLARAYVPARVSGPPDG